jgi:hypothetical protein
VEVVKAGLLPDDFGEQAPVLIEDLKDVTVDVDVAVRLVELSDANNARLQVGNVVDANKRTLFPGLAGEDDGTMTLYRGDGAISKLDCAIDLCRAW